MHTTALIIETSSIQSYVFDSNKLKENIGASHIIEHELFQECAPTGMEEKKVFVGGGKALYKFTDREKAKTFLNVLSLNVLTYFPGIQINAAIGDYDLSKFPKSRKNLNLELNKNKSYYPSNTLLPKDGIFADCPQSNEYQEVDYNKDDIISKVSHVKFDACKRAQRMLNDELKNDKFAFTDEIEHLGQQKDKGYIAVVHIDGNNIGRQFRDVSTEEDLIALSDNVRKYSFEAMDTLINQLMDEFTLTKLNEEIILKKVDEKGSKYLLPIRPILTGGDDITFVCEGRLGIYLAERFIALFEGKANQNASDGDKRITACAGIAIVKTKFPFFKAYQLAEELCHEAKKSSRVKGDSWISFHVAAQGVSGSLEDIRKVELTSANGMLTANPYSLDSKDDNALENLKSMTKHLKKNWPMNKVMELREVLKKSKNNQDLFKKEMEYRERKLPDDNLWFDRKTKYWDAMQLLEFYPQCFLKE